MDVESLSPPDGKLAGELAADAERSRPTGETAGRILIASGDPDLRTYCRHVLEPGYRVEMAADAGTALASIRERAPDLMLVDAAMLEASGAEWLHRLRAEAAAALRPVILLSARADGGGGGDDPATEADDCLVKPFTAHELLGRVRLHLKIARLRDEWSAANRKLVAECQEHVSALDTLHETSLRLAATRDRSVGLELVLDAALAAAGAAAGVLSLRRPGASIVELGASRGLPAASLDQLFLQSSAGSASERSTLADNDVAADPLLAGLRDMAESGGLHSSYAAPVVAREGSVIGVLSTYHAERDRRPSGREVRLLGRYAQIAADFIARCPGGAAVRDSLRADEHPGRLLALMPAGVYTCDPAGRITFFNRRAVELWGGEPRLNDDTQRFGASLAKGETEPPVAVALREGRSLRDVAVAMERPDGSRLLASMNIDVLRDAAGTITGAISVFRDAGERRDSEQVLRDSEREVAARFRFMADRAPALVWQTDLAKQCIWLNQRWLAFVGAALEEQTGERWTNWIHPVDRAHFAEEFAAAFDARREFALEFRLRRHDGSYRWILSHGVPFYESGGHFAGYLGSGIDFTERKDAELPVRQLAAIVESSDDAIISKDLSGVIQSWNAGAERIFGYTADEAVGRPITMIIPPERLAEEPEILGRIRRGERIQHFDTVRCRKDGVRIDISLTVSPIRNADGAVIGVSKIARDVTGRKRQEAELRRQDLALRESEDRFRTLADNIAQLAWMGDAAGAQFWFNQRWLDYTGLPIESARDWGWTQGLHPDHAERVLKRYREHMASGQIWEDTFPLRARDGRYRWFLSRATPIRDAAGRITRWLGTNTDITDWREAQEALRSSERQLRLVTDNAPIFLMQLDRQHRFKFVNRTYARRYGREVNELVGAPISEILGPAVYETLRGHIDLALTGRRVEVEVEIPYPNLGRRWMHLIYVPERNHVNTVIGLVAVLSDVHARKRAEREMELARDRALAASRAKDDFLATLSHELRTPLNPVLLLASESAEDPSLPAVVRADFATIRKNVELEARLIDDLLDLTRITRGKLSLDLRPHDIHTIIQDAIGTVRADMEQKRISLRVDLAADPSVVWGDGVRLQQVLWNLLKNAVKFTPDDGRITVRTENPSRADRVRIIVTDTGIGLTPPEMERVFDAFSQGDHAGEGGSHRFGGVGLGLAISRMLVERHEGAIGVTSEGRGRGAAFTVELPAIAAEMTSTRKDPTVPATSAAEGAAPADSNRPLARILLVDDHEPTRAALSQLLSRRHYEVVTVAGAAEALACAASRPFDILISDIGLPDGNGYDLMERLGGRYGLKGVAISGYGMEHDVARSQAAGFAAHLTKPVRIQLLESALAAVRSA